MARPSLTICAKVQINLRTERITMARRLSKSMKKETGKLPLCKSDYLQDLTIALGRLSLKSVRQSYKALEFSATFEEVGDATIERLNIDGQNLHNGYTKIVVWENATAWACHLERRKSALERRNSPTMAQELLATFSDMEIEDVAELIRATLKDFESNRAKWQRHADLGR